MPSGVLENSKMVQFDNDLVIRYLDNIVVDDKVYVVRFKACVDVKAEG